jgi:NAD(P)-dependent dehydrogenase (short-subunit alcohol dehydrogenase family)
VSKTWLITGVSSGFGRELAKVVLARGDTIAGTLRKEAQLKEFEALAPGRARAYRLDVTDAAAIPDTVARVVRDLGRIDVLVNNAGYGINGALEEISDAEARQLIETNFFGTLNMIRAVLPQMRAQRSGHVVNFSSSAGIIGIPGVSVYCAAKHAVEGLSESLAPEVAPFGIKVTIVEPGGFRTDFAGRSIVTAKAMPEYAETPAGKTRGMLAAYRGNEPGDPIKAMKGLLQALDAPEPPLRLVLGPDALGAGRHKLAALAKNYDAWEHVSTSTNLG